MMRSTTAAAAQRPLLVRYHAPDTSEGAPAGRAQTAWLISKDLGQTWTPCPPQDAPPAPFLTGRSFLFGSTAAGADLFDRLIAGSHFYFTPRVLSLSLLACFALCAVLAFVSAALCDTRNPWQYLLLRKLPEVFVNGIAAVPAIILLIVVATGVSASRAVPAEWAIIAAIVFTQIPNVYQYLYAAIAEYRSSERLAHDLSIGLSWLRILINKILIERCLRIFVIQAFYILGYIILFETTLSYLGFAPSGDLDSWGKLLVEEGRLPMARWLQTGVPGLNDWVFLAPLAWILLSIYAANRIGKLLARCLLPRRAAME